MTNKLDITQAATFEDGQFVSSVLILGDSGTLEGLETPVPFRTTDITFHASIDNTTFKIVQDANGAVVTLCDVTPNCYRPLNSTVTKGIKFLKLERGTTVGEEIIKVIIRHVI